MTEKEYVDNLTRGFSDQPWLPSLVRRALELAKQQGAKFDLEIVELPELAVRGMHLYSVIGVNKPLDSQQACEIIRRCKVVDELREFLLHHSGGASITDLLSIVNGD